MEKQSAYSDDPRIGDRAIAASVERIRTRPARLKQRWLLAMTWSLVMAMWSLAVVGYGWLWVASVFLGYGLTLLVARTEASGSVPLSFGFMLMAVGLLLAGALHPGTFIGHLVGATAGFTIFMAYEMSRKGNQRTDEFDPLLVVLGATGGAWLNWQGLALAFLIAAAAAIMLSPFTERTQSEDAGSGTIPLGTLLAAGIWLVWLYGPRFSGAA